jgi:hypothetical protein
MIMDYMRAGYTAPARWQDSGNATVTLRWYRAAEGAEVYTQIHAFGSTIWDVPDDIASTGPGEIPGKWEWSGSPPDPPPGLTSPTPPGYFQHGVPVNAPLPSCTTHVSVEACSCGYPTTFQ